MKVLVFGGREYADRKRMASVLLDLKPSLVIHGKCRGADTLAGDWAKVRGIPVQEFPADWNKFGRAAGPMRNQQMLDEGQPDVCVGFPGGKGTLNMANLARAAGVKVIMVEDHGG